jgi:hypothetical protein
MRPFAAALVLTLLPQCLLAQKVVTPDACVGPPLKRDDVLLIDLSESLELEAALAKAIEDHHLHVVKRRVIETEMAASMKGAFREAARIAGKESCDVVIVVRKGVGKEQETALIASGSGFSGYSLPDEDEWVAVIFADIEPPSDE